jgi:hypothetical protein
VIKTSAVSQPGLGQTPLKDFSRTFIYMFANIIYVIVQRIIGHTSYNTYKIHFVLPHKNNDLRLAHINISSMSFTTTVCVKGNSKRQPESQQARDRQLSA